MSNSQLRTTPTGQFYAHDVENLFAITIISLNLDVKGTSTGLLGHAYPWTFSVSEAVNTMSKMTSTASQSVITFSIKKEKVDFFLRLFLRAHLIHCPGDRIRAEPSNSMLLQPTAKGLHIVQTYCQRVGYKSKAVSELLMSNYNSMRLLFFERQVYSDKIVLSKMFIYLLFQRVIGIVPNIYSPNSGSDPLPQNTLSSIYGNTADFSLYSPVRSEFSINLDKSPPRKDVESSPYHHRFYTHPDSTSLFQYYVSSRGVRMFRDKTFKVSQNDEHILSSECIGVFDSARGRVTYPYCFTGRALWQWIMDCTGVIIPGEAADLISHFLEYGLMEPILLGPSTSIVTTPIIKSSAYYSLTAKGVAVSMLDNDVRDDLRGYVRNFKLDSRDAETFASQEESLVNPSSTSGIHISENIKLQELLQDAGLRLLFREYLDTNKCQENLLFYSDMENLFFNEKLMRKHFETKHDHADQTSKKVLRLVYAIYHSYLAYRAPHEINVSPSWKRKLHAVLYEGVVKTMIAIDSAMPILSSLNRIIYDLMAKDSLPKFVQTSEFQRAVKSLSDGSLEH